MGVTVVLCLSSSSIYYSRKRLLLIFIISVRQISRQMDFVVPKEKEQEAKNSMRKVRATKSDDLV